MHADTEIPFVSDDDESRTIPLAEERVALIPDDEDFEDEDYEPLDFNEEDDDEYDYDPDYYDDLDDSYGDDEDEDEVPF